MNINFRAPNIELTDDIRTYAEEKAGMLGKLLKDVAEENITVDIDLDRKQSQKKGDVFRVDITLHAGSERVHAVGRGETVLAAIDVAKDELTARMSRGKRKRLAALRRGGAKVKNILRFWK